MDALVQWLLSGRAASAVYIAVALSIMIMFGASREIRLRLRTTVFLGLASVVLESVVTHLARDQASDYRDLQAVAVALGALAVARFAFVVVVNIVIEGSGRHPINTLLRDILQASLYLLVVMVALRAAHMQPGSLLATGTVATAVIGLALQETLGNLAAGAAIQVERPVEQGDWIRLDKSDVMGKVVAMNWRSVVIETDDRTRLVIPNGVFSKTPFMNMSKPGPPHRRNLYFVVPYDVPPLAVHAAVREACSDCSAILADPPPSVLTSAYTERGVTYWLRYWIGDFSQRDAVNAEIHTRVWYQFHRRKMPHALAAGHVYLHAMDGSAKVQREAEVLLDRRAAIDGVDFLRPLSSQAKEMLAERGHRRLFAPGERVLRQGDMGRTFFIIRRGTVAVMVDGVEVARLGPGEFFGELALLTGKERHGSVVAVEECEVFEIDEVMFRDVLKGEPEVAEKGSAIVGERQAAIGAMRGRQGTPSVNDVRTLTGEILAKLRDIFALD